MNTITIECINNQPVDCTQQPVTLGVPFPEGTLKELSQLTLCSDCGKSIPLQTQGLNRWPDVSFKWVLCDFVGDVSAESRSEFFLTQNERVTRSQPGCVVDASADHWTIDTGKGVFTVDTEQLRPFRSVLLPSGEEILKSSSDVLLVGADGNHWQSHVEKIELETTGAVRTTLLLTGHFTVSEKSLNFAARIHFYSGSAKAKLELRLHNPAAAIHPDNLWDLGDPSSVMLKEWAVHFELKPEVQTCQLRPDDSSEWSNLPVTGGSLYQESSGGKNWDSPVHRDCSGDVPMTQSGWVLTADQLEKKGDRAQPTLLLEGAEFKLTAAIDHFWQRFPKELSCDGSSLKLGLLPGCFPAAHELQGGEQITEVIHLDFSGDTSAGSGSRLKVRCEAAVYQDAHVFGEGLWVPTDRN
jgi:hypothetical protein